MAKTISITNLLKKTPINSSESKVLKSILEEAKRLADRTIQWTNRKTLRLEKSLMKLEEAGIIDYNFIDNKITILAA